jgi:uncharacterized repeat protein (TIGR03847 family)
MSITNLGAADVLGAEAIGRPGQRRFRLFVRTRTSSAILWSEKEQLLDLSLAIDRMLAQVSEGRILRIEAQAGGVTPDSGDLPDDFPLAPEYDLQLGQVRLSFDEQRELFVLIALPFEIGEDASGEPQVILLSNQALSLLFTLDQAQRLTSRITFLLKSGRPVCPLCQAPLGDGPHACVKQNGHRQVVQILRTDEGGEEE